MFVFVVVVVVVGHHCFRHFLFPLAGKLVFPSSHTAGHFSMLGLGDVVMPGLLLCFVMRYDAYKRAQVIIMVMVCLSSYLLRGYS